MLPQLKLLHFYGLIGAHNYGGPFHILYETNKLAINII